MAVTVKNIYGVHILRLETKRFEPGVGDTLELEMLDGTRRRLRISKRVLKARVVYPKNIKVFDIEVTVIDLNAL